MLGGVVREAARRFGDRPAVVTPNGSGLTYRELDRFSDEAAAGMAAAGVEPGRVVALLLPSTVDLVVAYAAVAKLGAVAAAVNPRLSPPERRAAVEAVGPDVVVAVPGLAEGLPGDLDVLGVEPADRADSILSGLRRDDEAPPVLAGDPERPAVIVLTSGTTGAPRGALFAERQLKAIMAMDWGERWGGGGPMLASTELAHIGFMTKLPWYLRAGGPIHLLGRWRAADALRTIASERIPVVGAIPAQVALMLRDPGFDDHDLACVRTIVAGAAASPPALVREARERFRAGYSIRYSSTESGGLGTMTDPDADDDAEIESVGRPRTGIDLEVRVEDGRPVPAGEAGEVWLRSPAQMLGYRRDDEATATTIVDGWLRTGDLGVRDGEGRLRLVGRTSERYVRGGYNVAPVEVEAVLAAHPSVREIAVVPRPDAVMGEIGVAVVVPADAARPPDLGDLRAFGGERLAAYKLPEDLRVVEALPLTSLHKLDRRRLTALVTGPGEPVDPAATGSGVARAPHATRTGG